MAVGMSSSQSLLVQVGARYRDQDPDSASSRGRCLVAPGMSYLTHRAAPPTLIRLCGGRSKTEDALLNVARREPRRGSKRRSPVAGHEPARRR